MKKTKRRKEIIIEMEKDEDGVEVSPIVENPINRVEKSSAFDYDEDKVRLEFKKKKKKK